MYRFIPQKKRSSLRVALGTAFYTLLRYILWLRYHNRFVHSPLHAQQEHNTEVLIKAFPYVISQAQSPIYRNLSKDDSALQDGKAINLAHAIPYVHGSILKTGSIFSYWRLIGNPTKRKGYTYGMMLVNGKPTASIGGGLCALSNLIYWITLHTPLTVIERYRHSYDVFPDSNRTRPFGSGATCVYNYRDLMIRNDTPQDYVLLVYIKEGNLIAQWRSNVPQQNRYEVYQKEHWITSEVGGVYVRHNTLYRKCFAINDNTETLISDEKLTENHALMMYEPLLEQKK